MDDLSFNTIAILELMKKTHMSLVGYYIKVVHFIKE